MQKSLQIPELKLPRKNQDRILAIFGFCVLSIGVYSVFATDLGGLILIIIGVLTLGAVSRSPEEEAQAGVIKNGGNNEERKEGN